MSSFLGGGGGGGAGPSPGNPTATAGDVAINGSAATFMRSDAAPAVQKTSSSLFGICKVDGVTITAVAGVISAATGGGGNVSNVGTPVDNQLAVWTGATTIEGDSALTFDTTTDTFAIGASGKLNFGAVTILSDAAGVTTLQNIDALDATTTTTIRGIGAALTRTNDTNVTLTLGGSATTALLNAASMTLGWTGVLAETRGGTAQSTYVLGDLLYGSGANTLAKLAGNTTSTKKFLRQTGTGTVSAVPAWDTIVAADVPGSALTKTDDTNVTLTLGGTPSTALLAAASITAGWTGTLAVSRGGIGVGTLTAHGVLIGEGTSAVVATAAMTDGQLLVGQSAADPLPKTVAGDATMAASGSLTIANSAVTNAKQANMAAWTIKMNNSGSAAAPGDVTIDGLTAKASPVGADEVAIWDVAGAAMKKATITNLLGGSSVTSFNTRTGAVVPVTGDYSVTNIYAEKWFTGRLTLTSATPVLNANATAQGTVYYTPYTGNLISIYDGTRFVTYTYSELSVVLDATNFLSGKNYDFFVFNDAGTIRLGYGPAWTNNTTRSGAIARVEGIWTNSATMTIRYSSANTVSVATNQAVLVGTVRATANAQTGMAFTAAASGGGANVLGVYNVYNKVPFYAQSQDTAAGWTYTTATWRAADGNANNSVSYIDGLGDVCVMAWYSTMFSVNASGGGDIGINRNSTSATPLGQATAWRASGTVANQGQVAAVQGFNGLLGYNAINAVESADGGSPVFYGSGWSTQAGQAPNLVVAVDM